MICARVVNGAIVAYPYRLRPTAKQAHPEVSPLPGTWEQCTPEQLAALECVDVQTVARPELQPGESCAEGAPEYVGGQWRQTWVVTPAPPVPVPSEVQGHLCRIELIVRGEFDAVLAVIAAMPEPTRSIATEALYAPFFSRTSPTMAAVAQAMGWTSEDVDARFIAADARAV